MHWLLYWAYKPFLSKRNCMLPPVTVSRFLFFKTITQYGRIVKPLIRIFGHSQIFVWFLVILPTFCILQGFVFCKLCLLPSSALACWFVWLLLFVVMMVYQTSAQTNLLGLYLVISLACSSISCLLVVSNSWLAPVTPLLNEKSNERNLQNEN